MYQRIGFIDKSLSVVQKLHVKWDALELIWFDINDSGRIVYIVDHINILYKPRVYNILCLALIFWSLPSYDESNSYQLFVKKCIPCWCEVNRSKFY